MFSRPMKKMTRGSMSTPVCIRRWSPPSGGPRRDVRSRGPRQQCAQPDQVVGRRGEGHHPVDQAVMHHAALHTRPPGSQWLREYPAGVPFVPARGSSVIPRPSDEWLTNYAPGRPPAALPIGTAFLVKAGSDFVLQFHYTPNGTATTDRSKIGLIVAQAPPTSRAFIAPISDRSFVIPAGDSSYGSKASRTLATDAVLLSAGPHMHLAAKRWMCP